MNVFDDTVYETKDCDIHFVVNEMTSSNQFQNSFIFLYVHIFVLGRKINVCKMYTRSTFQTFFANVHCITKFYMI